MLSKPNVKEIMPKAGNRYQAALALSKRARNIEERRVSEGDKDIHDAVDLAAEEIVEEKAYVKVAGEYIIEPKIEELIIEDKKENEKNNEDDKLDEKADEEDEDELEETEEE